MRLVVDANIAISSMVAGKITDLLLSPKIVNRISKSLHKKYKHKFPWLV